MGSVDARWFCTTRFETRGLLEVRRGVAWREARSQETDKVVRVGWENERRNETRGKRCRRWKNMRLQERAVQYFNAGRSPRERLWATERPLEISCRQSAKLLDSGKLKHADVTIKMAEGTKTPWEWRAVGVRVPSFRGCPGKTSWRSSPRSLRCIPLARCIIPVYQTQTRFVSPFVHPHSSDFYITARLFFYLTLMLYFRLLFSLPHIIHIVYLVYLQPNALCHRYLKLAAQCPSTFLMNLLHYSGPCKPFIYLR